jgi:hypothetical protein
MKAGRRSSRQPGSPVEQRRRRRARRSAVLTLCDPDRSQSITYLGEARPWASFSQAMQNQLAELKR